MSEKNQIVDTGDLIAIFDDLGKDVIFDGLKWPDADEEAVAEFNKAYERLERDFFMSDPNESFYQGINVMAVIRRKSDGKLFGFEYWTPVSKHGEPYVESNGDEHSFGFEPPEGFDWDNDYFPTAYVFPPVEPFTITGYKVAK